LASKVVIPRILLGRVQRMAYRYLAIAAVGAVGMAAPAQAQILGNNAVGIQAVGATATSNFGAPYTMNRTHDQSDLSMSYVSGVTSTAMIDTITNLSFGNGWHGDALVSQGSMVYDLGSIWTLDRAYLYWMNSGSDNNAATLTFDVSADSAFSSFSTVGSLAGPTAPQNRVDFTSLATGRYVRINWNSLQGSYAGLNEFIAGGTIVAGAVPEPATWAMMLLGFGFVGGALRSAKRRQKLTVSYG
jgi:PEP-CTERM motif